ncbi:serine hydrolase domain-containing protein [Cellulomonas sp. ATA003]|uniref:serine hydrolase domain-containing protein n=1 Tax=Cellulomonas sp. ATA003 TaxID=3073064 RepID=UPI00287308E9|nr:serine hydrolase domain-containing protein [Cellulomonas sp. ATA003]WNB86917.1 serine hydrolase domain-containing protein [Cellulomonas sp. ATA003]
MLAFVDAIEAADEVEPHSLMLVRHGHVVAEGWWHPYTPDGLQLLYSLSKTFTASALGLAVAEGLVGLDDTVLSHFPEWDADVTDPRSRRMLVRHVASMASGHLTETLDRAHAADPTDLVRGFLLTPPDREPGSVFAYNQPCTYTVGAIVTRRTGQSLTEYLRPRLLDPIGIGDVAWQRDATGHELGYSGLHATTDAIARLGLLLLQRGEWDGARVLDAGWVEQASSIQVDNAGTNDNPDWASGYGFQLWQSQHGYRGDGAYGQFCVVLPEHDAVLAVTAATPHLQVVLDAAWEHLVPALAGQRPTADGADGGAADGHGTDGDARADGDDQAARADRALADRLTGRALTSLPGEATPPDGVADRWDGSVVEAVDGPVRRLAVTRAGGTWRVDLTGARPQDDGAPLTVTLGGADAAGWSVQEAALPDAGTVPVAVSGGWTGPDDLRFDVLFRETPHRLAVAATADGALTASWLTEPLGGAAWAGLRAPRT